MFQRNEKDDGGYLEVSTYSDLCPIRGVVERKTHDIPTRKSIEELLSLMVDADDEIRDELLRYVEAMSQALSEQREVINSLTQISSHMGDRMIAIDARLMKVENSQCL